MGKLVKPSDLRRKMLGELGLQQTKPVKHKHHKLAPTSQPIIAGRNKTKTMLYLELKYGIAIEDALTSGSLSHIVELYGKEIDPSTVSLWIKRFGTKYTATNLPVCMGCKHRDINCEYPTNLCKVLVKLELWELLEIKRRALQG